MGIPRHVCLVTVFLLVPIARSVAEDPTPILIDTDVGTGIGDAFALGLALGSVELDVLGATAVGDPARDRAMMLCRFLTMTGRRHKRVAFGAAPQPARPITDQAKYHYHPDPLFDRTTKPEKSSAVEFFHSRLKGRPGKVTLVALGPLTNVARLIDERQGVASLIRCVVLLESNIGMDDAAASKVFESSVPLLVLTSSACDGLTLGDAAVGRVFSPGTALTRQVETLYQMWNRRGPPLAEALAVALCFDERFATIEERSLVVRNGTIQSAEGDANARLVTSVRKDAFAKWYTERMASLVAPERRPSSLVASGGMPHRVHVAEDFDTNIERFWWMSGKPETALLPPGSRRACRGVLTHDFDDLLMVSRQMYAAVIFNPVPGPPMGKRTRLNFRYWLRGTDTLRVQIYSLTNGYHRHLVVRDLPQGEWRRATVDMTEARRPDGTGGPLGEGERIDDIQFYVDPDAEIVIDDIVLFDAGRDEKRPFPERILFSGVFDTGKQGQHWPGEFEIVPDAGNFWKAARSVARKQSTRPPGRGTGEPWLRIGLRGQRTLGARTQVSFRYRLTGADRLRCRLLNTGSGASLESEATGLNQGEWADATIEFSTEKLVSIDEVQLLLPERAELLIDDFLVLEPGQGSIDSE